MKTIDELLANPPGGKLTALTLWPAPGGWQANARYDRGSSQGWCCCTDKDAVNGLRRALTGDKPSGAAPADSGDIFG